MSKPRNTRSLDTIADDIHKIERTRIFDIGDLLIEAKASCELGEWLSWLEDEFDWCSTSSAENYMRVAGLASKFPKFRNLRLAKTTFYALADHDNEEELPAIIAELEKHATRKKLKPHAAERVIKIGIGRNRFGGHPDATLVQLVELDEFSDESWHQKAIAALREKKPETDEQASEIVDEISEEYRRAEQARWEAEQAQWEASLHKDDGDDDIESILASPPELPQSIAPPEPQKFGAATLWEGSGRFDRAVRDLLELRTKPAERFAGGAISSTELREVADFLIAVAAAEPAKAIA